ncbi:MAG: glycosyltransferase 87 family protein [Actinomycetota bacterium]|nr:glycosyltransferase 87 family protein [Actinomycetota bacterium]
MESGSGSPVRMEMGQLARLAPWFVAGLAFAFLMASRDHQADFLVFYKAASALAHGHNPYPRLGSPQVYDGSSYVYPVWVAFVLTPLTLLTPFAAATVWVALSFGAYAASFRCMGMASGPALFLAGLATPVIVSLQMGTLTPFLVLGVAVAWRWRDSPVVAAAAVALAGTSKLYLLALLVFFAATRRYRAFLLSLALSAALLGGGFLLGPISATGYAKLLLSLSKHESVHGWSLSAILAPLTGVGAARLVPQLAAVSAALFMIYRRQRDPSDRRAFAGAVAISLLATPILWSSYLPLLLPILFAAVTPAWALGAAAAFSWILTTPDRAGAALDAVSVALLAAVASFALLGPDSAGHREALRSSMDTFAARLHSSLARSKRALTLIALAAAAEAAVAAIHPALLPAIAAQDLVLASLAYALAPSAATPADLEVLDPARNRPSA